MATIIIGTLYPIILDSLNLEKISVGEPYFNLVFTPIMLFLLLIMGAAPHMNWGQQTLTTLWKKLRIHFILSGFIGFFSPLLFGYKIHILTGIGLSIAAWIILTTFQYTIKIYRSDSIITTKHWAMIIAHMGVAVFVLGVTVNKSYSIERQVKIAPGETVNVAGYHFTFNKMEKIPSTNYESLTARFTIQKNNRKPLILSAEQRVYLSHDQILNKPGVIYNAWRDLYLALGTSFPEGSWSVRIYYKPFVRLIWFGGFMLLIGGLLTLFSYRKKRGVIA